MNAIGNKSLLKLHDVCFHLMYLCFHLSQHLEKVCSSAGMWNCADSVFSAVLQVRGLARALRLKDAFGAIEDVRRRGVPLGDEVPFGCVVNSPLAPGVPLTVVQPHEGSKVRMVLLVPGLLLLCSSRQRPTTRCSSKYWHKHTACPGVAVTCTWQVSFCRKPTGGAQT